MEFSGSGQPWHNCCLGCDGQESSELNGRERDGDDSLIHDMLYIIIGLK